MNNIEIISIEYGKSVLAEDQIFRNGAKDKFRPIVFMIYLIKTENKLILVDAGCETMPGFEMENFIGPVNALKKLNISPDNITDVIITHAHHDHIESVKYFKNAMIYIQEDEYESGKEYLADNKNIKLFKDMFQVCPGVTAIKIGGHSKGSCIVEVSAKEKKQIIAGDECYLRECLEKQIPTGASFSPEKSEKFIKKYSDASYEVLLCHDK